VELGFRYASSRPALPLILHHEVMWAEHDVDMAVPMVERARERFPELSVCSFDRGFHSPPTGAGPPKSWK